MITMPSAALSALQRYILSEAAKSLPGLEGRAKQANESRQGAVAMGFSRPDLKTIRPSDISHITRSYILIDFYKLTLRKYRFCGRVTDQETNRIGREIAWQRRYDRACSSLYRAIKRLEDWGLIRRMSDHRGLQLTEKGIKVAKSFEPAPPAF